MIMKTPSGNTDYINCYLTMDSQLIIRHLEQKGVKATANRMLVYQALADAPMPVSLADIEDGLVSLDKSSIFRVLTLFVESDVAHSFSDGRGVVHYELCGNEGHCSHDNDHIHFYCERCRQTICFEDIRVPAIPLPADFEAKEISFLVQGICPKCRRNKSAT